MKTYKIVESKLDMIGHWTMGSEPVKLTGDDVFIDLGKVNCGDSRIKDEVQIVFINGRIILSRQIVRTINDERDKMLTVEEL